MHSGVLQEFDTICKHDEAYCLDLIGAWAQLEAYRCAVVSHAIDNTTSISTATFKLSPNARGLLTVPRQHLLYCSREVFS